MNRKRLSVVAITSCALLFGTVAIISKPLSKEYKNIFAETCIHDGNHYAAQAQTDDENGWKEFWVCCKCHEIFLEQPTGGTWHEGNPSAMTGEMNKEHPAFIASNRGGENGDYYIVDPFDEDKIFKKII